MSKLSAYLRHATPRQRDYIIGLGLGLDPLPIKRYDTFIQSDQEAIWSDWTNLGDDMMLVIAQKSHDQEEAA